MKFALKIVSFIGFFSLVFYSLHQSDFFNVQIMLADLGGIPWLYASIGTLFSILAGFVIQKEWENWNSLIDAVDSEVHTLREMWLWSRYLPVNVRDVFHDSIRAYLEEMADNGLYKSEQNIISRRIEESFAKMNATLFDMFQTQPKLATNAFSLFTRIIEQRALRMRYSTHHVPPVIKGVIFFATTLMIGLSMFIGVKNIWLDYIFTTSLSMLAFVIYAVINDLDHPLVPGGWHLTPHPYQRLLEEIAKYKR